MILVSGCGFGASRIRNDRNDYNQAIQQTNSEQLLLNLVRLKYRDTPFFMEVSSVAAQFTYTATGNASASVPESAASVFGFGAGGTVQEKPTVTFAPLQGEKFIQRVLSPISLETISLLYHSGWRMDRLFSLCLDRLNDIKNAPNATGPTPTRAPQYQEFASAVHTLNEINERDWMELDFHQKNGIPSLVIQFEKEVLEGPRIKKLSRLLGVAPQSGKYYLAPTVDPYYIRIETRSLLGIMYYLSQGIDVPEEHQEQGKVTQTRNDQGSSFDWKTVTGDLLRIRSASSRPETASVAIRHRGYWFYVDDSDLSSKSTFSLLSQIFSLQAGKVSSTAPLLTLPIGQ